MLLNMSPPRAEEYASMLRPHADSRRSVAFALPQQASCAVYAPLLNVASYAPRRDEFRSGCSPP